MVFKSLKHLKVFYILSMIITFLVTTGAFYFYYNSGLIRLTDIDSIYKSGASRDLFKDENYLLKAKDLVSQNKPELAIKQINQLMSEASQINNQYKTEIYENVKSEYDTLKANLDDMISSPDINSIVAVLKNKMNLFESFVVKNNWRTLTRISSRLNANMSLSRVKSDYFFAYDNLISLQKSLQSDVDSMKKITIGSALSVEDKNVISLKLDSMNTEIEMMAKHSNQMHQFSKKFENFQLNFKSWFAQVEPQISLQKIEFETKAKKMIFIFAGLALLPLILGIFGFFIFRMKNKTAILEVEKIVLSTINNGIISKTENLGFKKTESFTREFELYRQYIHKRMSFGMIFQEALPFSAILLDANLRVVWANNLFYENWSLEEYKLRENALTWDFIQRFTNLSDNDPVLEARNNHVAGIYHIQVKLKQNEESLPYEMYVSPVEYGEHDRIMLLFYPLKSAEETLHNHTKAIISPVSKALEALRAGLYDSKISESIKKDLSIAGVENLFNQFNQLNEITNERMNALNSEINHLEEELADNEKNFCEIKQDIEKNIKLELNIFKSFKSTKEKIVNVINLRTKLQEILGSTISNTRELVQHKHFLLSSAKSISNSFNETSGALNNVVTLKSQFKGFKDGLVDVKSSLIQSIDQLLIFQRTDEMSPLKLEQALYKVKNEVRSLDKNIADLMKLMTSLDVSLSKVNMIIENIKLPDLTVIDEDIIEIQKQAESNQYEYQDLSAEVEKNDNDVVKTLKTLFGEFSLEKEVSHHIYSILKSRKLEQKSNLRTADYSEKDEDIQIVDVKTVEDSSEEIKEQKNRVKIIESLLM